MTEPTGERRCAVGVGSQGEPIFEQFVRKAWADAEMTRLRDEIERLNTALKLVRAEADGWTRTAVKYKERIATLEAEVERLTKQVRECPTCDGSGNMDVVVRVLPPDGREEFEIVECAECRGTGVSSWGQAIDESDQAKQRIAALETEIADFKAHGHNECVAESDALRSRLAEREKRIEKLENVVLDHAMTGYADGTSCWCHHPPRMAAAVHDTACTHTRALLAEGK